MDLGGVGLDGLIVGGSETGFVHSSCLDTETKEKWCGSGFLKQGRSSTVADDDLRGSKMAKIGEDASRSMLLQQQRDNTPPLFSHLDGGGGGGSQQQQQQMLCFSNPKSETFSSSSPNATLGYHHPLSSYTRNNNAGGGYSSWRNNNMNMMHGAIFTPSQWMELEHQALIYKYITANVPVPSHLLIPIRKALDSAAFSHFSNTLLRPSNPLGWGGFHLGFSSNTDPEPGRCRRTDGKKWRCSRDAVVDQKYCERHMNRGRHRSRKPVEGLNNSGHHHNHHHTLNTTTTTTTTVAATTTTTPPTPNSNTSNSSSSKLPFSPNSASITSGQGSLPSDASPTAANTISRMFMNNNNKENNNNAISERINALPMLPPTLDLKPKENPFMIHHHKQQFSYEESSSSSRNNIEFGLVTSDSLLNPSNRDTAKSSQQQNQHSLWNFIDDCPKTTPHNSDNNRTQLSISIPIAPSSSSDFISFNSSPNDEKLTLSPLRLSRELELDPIQMGLGVGSYANEESNTTRQASWIPITWERSSNHMGGPLGEVLNLSSNNNNNNNNNNSSNDRHCGKDSNLNLMSDGWDNSPSIGSSPTGVLQKTAFGSLSNSSAGSSPRGVAENNNNKGHQEGASLCNDLLGNA